MFIIDETKIKVGEQSLQEKLSDINSHSDENITSVNAVHGIRQGSGNGLDADKLDGIQGTSFLRSDATDEANSVITFNAGAKLQRYQYFGDYDDLASANTGIKAYVRNGVWNIEKNTSETNNIELKIDGNKVFHEGNLETIFPVGFTYTQFPNDPTPSEMGFYGSWLDKSSEIDGRFIRYAGTNANAFEGAVQGDAIRNITGSFGPSTALGVLRRDANVQAPVGAFYGISTSKNYRIGGTSTGTSPQDIGFRASNVVVTSVENRPINITVKKWKRMS